VETQSQDPDSILSFYKEVLHLRRTEAGLREGAYVPLNELDPNVLSYLRKSDSGTTLVVLNFSGRAQNPSFDLTKQGFSGVKVTALVKNAADVPDGPLKGVKLGAYGVYIGRVSP
jgi:glycosidase